MTLEPCTICQSPAAWSCPSCGRKCADHVRRVKGPRQRFRCEGCGADAELLRVRRSELSTFRERVKPSMIVLGRPVLAIVLASILFALSAVKGVLGLLLGVPVALAFALVYLRAIADREEFDWPPLSEARDELGKPLGAALVALLPVLVLVWVGVQLPVLHPWRLELQHTHSLAVTLLRAPTFWLVALFAIAWTPFALLNATVATTLAGAINPVAMVRAVRRFPRVYGWVSAFAGTAFVATFLAAWVLPTGYFGLLVTSLLACYALFATARLLGEFLYLHPEEFGWGRADESFVDLGDPQKPSLFEPKAAPPAPANEMTTSLEGQMSAALEAKDVQLVLRLFKSTPDADSILTPPTLLRVGQAAASASEYGQALKALLSASRSESQDGAKALVIGARILDERLRDHEGAKRLFEQCVERFPTTQAAEFARKQLADPRFFLSRKPG